MAVYKVIQDVEAEDKLFGWMSLKQFIFFCIAVGSGYMCFFSVIKGFPWAIIFFFPVLLVTGLLAAPLSKVQPTEVWLAARIRFYIKPRRRIWDQTGIEHLVTVTAPVMDKHIYTNNLSQGEVVSRLNALARTLDSRGWAIRNVNANLYAQPSFSATSNSQDRLIPSSSTQSQVPTIDVAAADDILDADNNAIARRLDEQVKASTQKHHQAVISKIQTQDQPPTKPIESSMPRLLTPSSVMASSGPAAPVAVKPLDPTLEEQQKLAEIQSSIANLPKTISSGRTINPLSETDKKMTDDQQSAMIKLANNNELSLRTIASEAKRVNGEVVIKLR
jgi:PrgI family protein